MCLEDVRLGRQEGSSAEFISCPNATATQLCGQDPLRTAIILSVAGANAATVAPNPLSPSSGNGFRLSQSLPPLILTIQEHGLVVTQPWYGSGDGATSVVTVITSRLEKQ